MLEIYQELRDIMARGERAVLVTVISSRGSAPRKAGTKMLVRADGSYLGTIGGGFAQGLSNAALLGALQRRATPELPYPNVPGSEQSPFPG